jgi:hypothetical protein
MDELARMNAEEEKGGARSAIILVVIIILVAGYCVEFGLQTLACIKAHQWNSANPWLSATPQPLPVASTPEKGTQTKAFDYEFIVPWAGTPKITPSETGVEIRYETGQVIIFFDPDTQLDTIKTLKSPTSPEAQKFETVFANAPIESNFALYQAVYGASPSQISPFMKEADAIRMNVLLLWKLSFGLDLTAGGTPELYSFDWGKIRGFQFGDPFKDNLVAVRVFDDRDRQFRFIFLVTAGSSAKIAQDDINTIVQSLQSVPITER